MAAREAREKAWRGVLGGEGTSRAGTGLLCVQYVGRQ